MKRSTLQYINRKLIKNRKSLFSTLFSYDIRNKENELDFDKVNSIITEQRLDGQNLDIIYNSLIQSEKEDWVDEIRLLKFIKQYEAYIDRDLRFSDKKADIITQYLSLIDLHIQKQISYVDRSDIDAKLIRQSLLDYSYLHILGRDIKILLDSSRLYDKLIEKLKMTRRLLSKEIGIADLRSASFGPSYCINYTFTHTFTITLLRSFVDISFIQPADSDTVICSELFIKQIELLIKHLLHLLSIQHHELTPQVSLSANPLSKTHI